MEKIIKARKIHQCINCHGNIQKGEKYLHGKLRVPVYEEDIQTGIEYISYRSHNKDCVPRLLGYEDIKNILKNCNFGIHNPTYDMDPDSYDDSEWCKWCGKELLKQTK